jgi:NAD(P)-dependent dehydrogenase (short-subunit alcohol dehydrogenase family)
MDEDRAHSLTGRIAIVTGASRGIGAAIAQRLARDGASVALAARTFAGTDATATAIRDSGADAMAFQCDVADSDAVARLVDNVLELHGRIDIVINNAGVSPLQVAAEDLPETVWDTILDTNLKGAFLLATAAAPAMIAAGGGAVVNISSIAGLSAIPGEAAYSASKAGLIGLTRALAFEWARHGIRVNTVAPGYVATEMNREVREHGAMLLGSSAGPPRNDVDGRALAAFRRVVGRTPMGRFGDAGEIAEVVAFLASDRSSFMTGETVTVDGGWIIGDGLA